MVNLKRRTLIGACAFVIGVGPLVFASPAAADCPYGTVQSRFAGVCTAGSAPGAPSGPTVPIAAGSPATSSGPPGSGFNYVDGIPCNSAHASECLGLSMSQPGH